MGDRRLSRRLKCQSPVFSGGDEADSRHPIRNLATRTHSFLFRATGGRFGRKVRGAPVLVLESRGRKTGKARTVPLLYIEDAGDSV